MKKNASHNSSDKKSNVKEISDGVYINLNRITSHELDFGQAIEESFKNLDEKPSTKQKIENLDEDKPKE